MSARNAAQAAADFVSQRSSLTVLGIPARTFLEMLREPACPEVLAVGQLRLVDRAAFVAWLRARPRPAAKARAGRDIEVDRLAADLGLSHLVAG